MPRLINEYDYKSAVAAGTNWLLAFLPERVEDIVDARIWIGWLEMARSYESVQDHRIRVPQPPQPDPC